MFHLSYHVIHFSKGFSIHWYRNFVIQPTVFFAFQTTAIIVTVLLQRITRKNQQNCLIFNRSPTSLHIFFFLSKSIHNTRTFKTLIIPISSSNFHVSSSSTDTECCFSSWNSILSRSMSSSFLNMAASSSLFPSSLALLSSSPFSRFLRCSPSTRYGIPFSKIVSSANSSVFLSENRMDDFHRRYKDIQIWS